MTFTGLRKQYFLALAALMLFPLPSQAQRDGGGKGIMPAPCALVQEDFRVETAQYVQRDSVKLQPTPTTDPRLADRGVEGQLTGRTKDFNVTVDVGGRAVGVIVNYHGPDGAMRADTLSTINQLNGHVINPSGTQRARISCNPASSRL